MDSTANASKPNSQKSGNELIEEVVNSLLEPSTILDDLGLKILIQDALQLPSWVAGEQGERRTYRGTRRRAFRAAKVDTHYKHGDIWHEMGSQLDLGWLDC